MAQAIPYSLVPKQYELTSIRFFPSPSILKTKRKAKTEGEGEVVAKRSSSRIAAQKKPDPPAKAAPKPKAAKKAAAPKKSAKKAEEDDKEEKEEKEEEEKGEEEEKPAAKKAKKEPAPKKEAPAKKEKEPAAKSPTTKSPTKSPTTKSPTAPTAVSIERQDNCSTYKAHGLRTIEAAFPNFSVEINQKKSRKKAFEVILTKDGSDVTVWSGFEKEPRAAKFPDNDTIVGLLKAKVEE
ncbi:hypothetical protein HDU97_000349 [Phlyctochytrium planicorne]|nr:hypothetical protein HDU97_000349 [Phlyctochytrium planicorne]